MRSWIIAFALLAAPAEAQVDPMEQQRCVWRCLADSPGNDSPEYNQCVAAKCTDAALQPDPAPQVAQNRQPAGAPAAQAKGKAGADGGDRERLPEWTSALASDGQRHFAGAEAKQHGRSFYYICTPQGQSYYAIFGLNLAAARLKLRVGSVEYLVPFDWVNGEYAVSLPPNGTVMQALKGNGRLRIQDEAGKGLVTLSLRGSAKALDAAVAACAG